MQLKVHRGLLLQTARRPQHGGSLAPVDCESENLAASLAPTSLLSLAMPSISINSGIVCGLLRAISPAPENGPSEYCRASSDVIWYSLHARSVDWQRTG